MVKARSRNRMTIIYRGKVIKVENVPVDKGKQLIQSAQSVNNPPPPERAVVVDVPDEEPAQDVAEPSAAITINQTRFLGKRKQRWVQSSHACITHTSQRLRALTTVCVIRCPFICLV